MLKQETDKSKKLQKNEVIREMRGFMELYSTYQPDYNYWDYKTAT